MAGVDAPVWLVVPTFSSGLVAVRFVYLHLIAARWPVLVLVAIVTFSAAWAQFVLRASSPRREPDPMAGHDR